MPTQAPNHQRAQTTSEGVAHWLVTARTLRFPVEVDDQAFGTAPPCPSLESLSRRHEASDTSWQEDWLADDVDPCTP